MENNSSSYRHILKYTGIFGSIQGLNILMALIRSKFVAILLGPDGMGLISLFNSTAKLITDSTSFGIPMSAVKNISEAFSKNDETEVKKNIRVVRSWSLLLAVLGMVVCMFAGPFVDAVAFNWGNHTLHFILLSPIVGLSIVTGGETAILKGTQRLKGLASISSLNVLLSLITTVPIYYFWGEKGIVPSLVLIALIQMLLTIRYSLRYYPAKFDFSRATLGQGAGMIRLGIAFVLAGVMGSGVEFAIRSWLNNYGTLDTVGLYNAGYMIIITYGGMVFSALESDYFPRLSAITSDTAARNITINNQMEVLLLLISPMIVGLIVFMPVIVPLLLSGKFVPAITMMQIMALSLYGRSMAIPMQYLPLSRGDSYSFLFIEAVNNLLLFFATILFYDHYGLFGAGLAFTVVSIIDVIVTFLFLRMKYTYVLSSRAVKYILAQVPLGLCAMAVSFISCGWVYWIVGITLLIVSVGVSLLLIRDKSSLWNRIKSVFKVKKL